MSIFEIETELPKQTRELLIRETDLKLNLPAPFLKDWREARRVQKQVVATRKCYAELLKRYDAKVTEEKTPADILIKGLFAAAQILDEDEQLLKRAHFRYLRGHPPRKNDQSFGDAITWELLLATTDDDLVIITKDSDFSEKRKGITSFNGFLEREWLSKHDGKTVKLYVSLGEFINALEKREAVKKAVVQKEKAPDGVFRGNAVLSYPTNTGAFTVNAAMPFLPQSGAFTLRSPSTPYLPESGVFNTLGNSGGSLVFGPGLFSQGGGIAFASPAGSSGWIEGSGWGETTFGGSEAARGDRPLKAQERRMKHCPYCGKDITTDLVNQPILDVNKFTCPGCNSEFDPGAWPIPRILGRAKFADFQSPLSIVDPVKGGLGFP